jgi:hypothetical protein
MSTTKIKRKKSTHANFRLTPEDFDFIEKFSSESGLKKIQVVELALDLLREVPKSKLPDVVSKSVMSRYPVCRH